jgi:transaldolase
MNRLEQLRKAGVSIWLDTLSRDLVESDRFERYVRHYGVTGATSNPTIFERAITRSSSYDRELERLVGLGTTAKAAFFELALDDVRRAAKLLSAAHEASAGGDGFVSFEVTPDLADDSAGTVVQALAVWRRLQLPNVMIKVPATAAGVKAIERLTSFGVNVNVTLLFSVERYEQVVDAYLRGLEQRLEAGRPVEAIFSAASFFVSRVDTKANAVLTSDSPLRGRIAVANAHRAYARYRELFGGDRWARLRAAGAREQRPLWASTGTKDPSLSDVHYVERLIAPGVINTMPEKTLFAFANHGEVREPLDPASPEPDQVLGGATEVGVDLDRITAELEREGIESFSESYERLLRRIDSRLVLPYPAAASAAAGCRARPSVGPVARGSPRRARASAPRSAKTGRSPSGCQGSSRSACGPAPRTRPA